MQTTSDFVTWAYIQITTPFFCQPLQRLKRPHPIEVRVMAVMLEGSKLDVSKNRWLSPPPKSSTFYSSNRTPVSGEQDCTKGKAHQDTSEEVKEGIAALLLVGLLRVREALPEGVGTDDIRQLAVLEIPLACWCFDPMKLLKFRLAAQLRKTQQPRRQAFPNKSRGGSMRYLSGRQRG